MYRRDIPPLLPESDYEYWPNWQLHYAPTEKPRSRLHHRNNFAPPPYSTSIPPSELYESQYPRLRKAPVHPGYAPVPASVRRAEALLSLPYEDYRPEPRYPAVKLYPIPLTVRCDVKSIEATIIWDTPAFRIHEPAYFSYFLCLEGGARQEIFELANWKTRLTVSLTPGTYYQVSVEAVTPGKVVVGRGLAEFKAVFDAIELRNIYELAVAFIRPLNEKKDLSGMQRFKIFYRNKPTAYFDQVRLSDFGIMKKYRKDDNGHPASAINGEIDGLFFNGRMPGGKMPTHSPFGNIRLSVPAELLFTPRHRLYFADFYCNNTTHYVTVVACIPESTTDLYCRRWLLPLDPTSNMFLISCYNQYTGEIEHYINASIWVEFYYTEDVPICWGWFDSVFSTGQSKPNGLPNNKTCTICNLYPIYPTMPTALLPPKKPPTKRRASGDQDSGPAPKKRRSLLDAPIPITAATFVREQRPEQSTFHYVMELQRQKTVEDGIRLECLDPDVVEVVCYLVDEVSKEDGSNKAETSLGAGGIHSRNDEGYDSTATSVNSILQLSASSDGLGSESFSLPDKEFDGQTEALVEFNTGKDLISVAMKNVDVIIADTKKMEGDLCKKIQKLDQ